MAGFRRPFKSLHLKFYMNTELHFSSKSSDWNTPQDLFDRLDREYEFELDVAADHENTKCGEYFSLDGHFLQIPNSKTTTHPIRFSRDTGLEGKWGKRVCWCNPPYGRAIGKWIQKAANESQNGATVVCLLPARTCTRWFHDYIYKKPNVTIEFLKGRLKFGGSANSAPFPSMIVVFSPVPHGDPLPIEDNIFTARPLLAKDLM